MRLNELSGILWRERELLELLLFKLEEEQLILTSGRTRWLSHATREVEVVLEQIRTAELGRAVEVDAAAAALGLEPGVSLLTLAESAPPPWDELLLAHREAFVKLTTEINELAESNRDLLATSHRATQETLLSLQEDVRTYGADGTTRAPAATSQLLDEAL